MTETHLSAETLSDYVLGLLDPVAQRDAARHIATCDACREQVRRERALAPLVRDAVDEAIRPNHTRLHRLMPATPTVRYARQTVRRMVAVTALLLVIFLANLGMLHGTAPAAHASDVVAAPNPTLVQATPLADRTPNGAAATTGTPSGQAPAGAVDAAPVPIPTPGTPTLD